MESWMLPSGSLLIVEIRAVRMADGLSTKEKSKPDTYSAKIAMH